MSGPLRTNALLEQDASDFVIPGVAVQFGPDITVADMLAGVREAAGKPNVPERRLKFSEFVVHIAGVLVRDTAFERKVQLNQVPRPDHLNLYIIDSDPRRLVPQFKGNCTYIGYQNAVVCDAAFIASRLDDFSAISTNFSVLLSEFSPGAYTSFQIHMTQNLPLIRSLLKQNFLTWLIGHEIGHAVRHRSLLLSRGGIPNAVAIEREADEYVAAAVLRDPALGNQFFIILGELLQQEFRREYGERNILSGTRALADRRLPAKTTLHMTASVGRVPLLIRGLRVAEACMRVDPNVRTRAYVGRIGENVVLVHPLNDEFVTYLWSRVHLVERRGDGPRRVATFRRLVVPLAIVVAIAAAVIIRRMRRNKV